MKAVLASGENNHSYQKYPQTKQEVEMFNKDYPDHPNGCLHEFHARLYFGVPKKERKKNPRSYTTSQMETILPGDPLQKKSIHLSNLFSGYFL